MEKATQPVRQVALPPGLSAKACCWAWALGKYSGFSIELPLRDSAGFAPDFPREALPYGLDA